MPSDRIRATVSDGPPAANGTTIVTGRSGYAWADASVVLMVVVVTRAIIAALRPALPIQWFARMASTPKTWNREFIRKVKGYASRRQK
jgi:hypothetical protein